MLSETCKDLLRRLLQRNPKDRISFEQFFNHPFIDLDHMPDSNSFSKAVRLLFFDSNTKTGSLLPFREIFLRKQLKQMREKIIYLHKNVI